MSRLGETFAALQAKGRRALIPFLMAGDPSLESTAAFLARFAEAGADVLEVGIPFSDPIADGPVNERAAQRALRQGATVAAVFEVIAEARRHLRPPIVLLSYYNPILRFGLDAFCRRAAASGVDGIVIPDLPPEEGDALRMVARPARLDVIFLAAPTSTDARLARVAGASSGFIYCVSLTGVTGVRETLPGDIGALVARLRKHTTLPICVGFGVSTAEHARQVAAHADGVIVGSAIVSIIEREGPAAGASVQDFVRMLRRSIDGPEAAASWVPTA